MHVLVTGATGFIGRALCLRLARDGHQVTAWVRDRERARGVLGPDCGLIETGDEGAMSRAAATVDAIINLAGEPIMGGRWTRARKARLHESRLGPTRAMVALVRDAARLGRAPVLISTSAVGWYGSRGDEVLDEGGDPGEGFAAELCAAWEAAALEAADMTRVVIARIGIVLGREGGALASLLPLSRALLGGPIAGGAQWTPWIHLDDVVEAFVHLLASSALSGPVNVVGPNPIRQHDFAKAIGRAVGKPAVLPTPRFALRLALGEAAFVLVMSQRAVPSVLVATGFSFRFPDLDAALRDLTTATGIAIRRLRPDEAPASEYVRARRPRYVLVARTEVRAPLAEVFPFFASAENLQLLTPPAMAFEIATPRPIAMADHTVIDYRLKILGVPARWKTVIESFATPWQGEAMFVDAQYRGPYRAWWHEHRFRASGDRTVMEDIVYYAPPFGLLGALANRLVVAAQLRRIFGFRTAAIRQRFGEVS